MSESWSELRDSVLERDSYACRFCGTTNEEHIEEHGRGLDAHHIIPRSDGGADAVENLVALCRSCHRTMENLHGQAMGQLKSERDHSDDLEALTRIFDETEDEISQLEYRLQEYVESHPTFDRRFGFFDAQTVSDSPTMKLEKTKLSHSRPEDGVAFISDWTALIGYGYKEGMYRVIAAINGESAIPMDE